MINPVSFNKVAVPNQPSVNFELNPKVGFFSIRKSATVTTLNNLGVKVLNYSGAGMAPIDNITTPLGFLGGSVYQRTVVRPQVINLACAVFGGNLLRVQRIKQALINLLAPSNAASQQAADLYLRYQLYDDCGLTQGIALEAPVVFIGDLTGNTKDLNQERFVLQFMILAPPGIVELTTNQPSLAFNVTQASFSGYLYKSASTGIWTATPVSSVGLTALFYDQAGELWYGTSGSTAKISNRSGFVNQVVQFTATPANSAVYTIVQGADGKIYVGGNFNTPQQWWMSYPAGGGAPTGLGSALNNTVYGASVGRDGNIYIGGSFTTPANNFAWQVPGSGLSFIGGAGAVGGAGVVLGVLAAPDGSVYIYGGFTSFNGVACGGLCKFDPVHGNTFTAVGTGVAGGGATINSATFTLDGKLVIGGDFATVNGIAASNIAIYNGTSWQPMGSGLNNFVRNVTTDPVTGDVYVFGDFTQTVANTYPITTSAVRWNGSQYMPMDVAGQGIQRAAIRPTDREMALGAKNAATLSYSGSTSVSYGGTAEVLPQIKFTGPGQVYYVSNSTTKRALIFNNYILVAGETATLTLGPGLSFLSNTPAVNTNILNRLLAGSDVSTFSLVPGINNINAYMTGTTGASKIELIYKNTHWSFEAGV